LTGWAMGSPDIPAGGLTEIVGVAFEAVGLSEPWVWASARHRVISIASANSNPTVIKKLCWVFLSLRAENGNGSSPYFIFQSN
jgi:hypothetical protein